MCRNDSYSGPCSGPLPGEASQMEAVLVILYKRSTEAPLFFFHSCLFFVKKRPPHVWRGEWPGQREWREEAGSGGGERWAGEELPLHEDANGDAGADVAAVVQSSDGQGREGAGGGASVVELGGSAQSVGRAVVLAMRLFFFLEQFFQPKLPGDVPLKKLETVAQSLLKLLRNAYFSGWGSAASKIPRRSTLTSSLMVLMCHSLTFGFYN